MKIVIPGERTWSWNRFYSQSIHHTQRTKHKNEVRLLVREQLDLDTIKTYDVPVKIRVTCYFNHHPQDPDNIYDKPFIDALIWWGLIQDDKGRYVREVTTRSRVDPSNPRVEIDITEYSEDGYS